MRKAWIQSWQNIVSNSHKPNLLQFKNLTMSPQSLEGCKIMTQSSLHLSHLPTPTSLHSLIIQSRHEILSILKLWKTNYTTEVRRNQGDSLFPGLKDSNKWPTLPMLILRLLFPNSAIPTAPCLELILLSQYASINTTCHMSKTIFQHGHSTSYHAILILT